MKFLLLYKGSYGAVLRGPEMRYTQLSSELVAMGHRVTLCGNEGNNEGIPAQVGFVPVGSLHRLLQIVLAAEVIVLHGGGPVVLSLACLGGVLGKKIVLDSYVPHWIELEEILLHEQRTTARLRLLIKSYFNVMRCLLGGLAFDRIVVANQRQLDLFRGMLAPFSLTQGFSRIAIIPFGCQAPGVHTRETGRQLLMDLSAGAIARDDFLIGWLGGTYGWFDLGGILEEISRSASSNPKIRMVFFGVEESRKQDICASLQEPGAENSILFLPWIDYSKRFDYWAGLDASLVWGSSGYENDYASRTRNFDCLTLGTPIIQNADDEWGPRLQQSGAALVVDKERLGATLLELSSNPEKMLRLHESMLGLAAPFNWNRFAKKLLDLVSKSRMPIGQRLVGLSVFLLALPAIFLRFAFAVLKTISARR